MVEKENVIEKVLDENSSSGEAVANETEDKKLTEFDILKGENQKLKEENESLRQKVIELEDAYLRKVADFDNYRKRMLAQMAAMETEGIKKVIKEFLPLVDNFERALKSSKENKDFDSLYDGLNMIYSLSLNLLEKFNVKPFDSKGQEFDHNLHEAVMMEEKEDLKFDYVVLEELEKGYKFGNDVLRHARVKVGKKKKNNEEK